MVVADSSNPAPVQPGICGNATNARRYSEEQGARIFMPFDKFGELWSPETIARRAREIRGSVLFGGDIK
jgi:hypothetical protein